MRTFVAAIALLALTACGQSTSTTTATAPPPAASAAPGSPAWAEQFGASPRVVRTYDLATLVKSGTASVHAGANGAEVATNVGAGAMSAVLDLGADAKGAQPLALRVTAQVTQGSFQIVSIHKGWPAGYQPFYLNIAAGNPTSVLVPIDTNGDPLLVVSNAVAPASRGRVISVELVAPAP